MHMLNPAVSQMNQVLMFFFMFKVACKEGGENLLIKLVLFPADDIDAFPDLAQRPLDDRAKWAKLRKALYVCSVLHPPGDRKSTSVKRFRLPAGFLEAVHPRKCTVEEREASANWRSY